MPREPRVLLVDDEPAVRFTLAAALGDRGFVTVEAATAEAALPHLDGVDAVVTDLAMPGMGGAGLLARAREHDPDLPVVVVTARGSERAAVAAMKAGAHDYLAKPFDVDELALVVTRAVEARRLRVENRRLVAEQVTGGPVVGTAPAFLALVRQARRVAARDVTVLVRGPTGSGKELVAGLLHAGSARARGPLIKMSCAAIPAELVEAELFGHARGAYTGAVAARAGFFGEAEGGTLVLDEIGELPAAAQAKLLRALSAGEIQPVGVGRATRVDVRVVACTNRDLKAEAAAGRFRDDLYYRLAVVELIVPSLAERREDIPPLLGELTRRWAARLGLPDARLSDELVAALAARDWPGNVRELENTVARLLALSTGGLIDVDALDVPAAAPATPSGGLRGQLADLERSLIERTLAETGGNQSEAARRLQITRVTLIDKMRRHGLSRP